MSQSPPSSGSNLVSEGQGQGREAGGSSLAAMDRLGVRVLHGSCACWCQSEWEPEGERVKVFQPEQQNHRLCSSKHSPGSRVRG